MNLLIMSDGFSYHYYLITDSNAFMSRQYYKKKFNFHFWNLHGFISVKLLLDHLVLYGEPDSLEKCPYEDLP